MTAAERGRFYFDREGKARFWNRHHLLQGSCCSFKMSHGIQGGLQHANQLALTIGDLVAIEETQTAHQGQYYIVGEYHKLTMGETLFQTTWFLEPAALQYPWKLGVTGRSEVSVNTFLTY